jgi:hypothetical protein
MTENKVLIRIFVNKESKQQNDGENNIKELHDLYSSPNTVSAIMSRPGRYADVTTA